MVSYSGQLWNARPFAEYPRLSLSRRTLWGSDVLADRQFQLFNAFEDTVPNSVLLDVSKPSFDDVQLGNVGWSEVDVKPLVSLQPVDDFGMLVRCVIVNNQMQVEILRCFRVDLL